MSMGECCVCDRKFGIDGGYEICNRCLSIYEKAYKKSLPVENWDRVVDEMSKLPYRLDWEIRISAYFNEYGVLYKREHTDGEHSWVEVFRGTPHEILAKLIELTEKVRSDG
jgi:hypothetical protein